MSPLLAPPLPSCLPSSTSCATLVWMCFFFSLHFFSLLFPLLADCQTPCPAFSNYTRSPALRSSLLQTPPLPSTLVFSAVCISSLRSRHASSRPPALIRLTSPSSSLLFLCHPPPPPAAAPIISSCPDATRNKPQHGSSVTEWGAALCACRQRSLHFHLATQKKTLQSSTGSVSVTALI